MAHPLSLTTLALCGVLAAGLASAPASATQTATRVVCTADNSQDCLNGVSAGVVGGDAQQVSARLASEAARATDETDPEQTSFRLTGGIAAGGTVNAWGVWGSLGYVDFDGEPVFGTNITPYEGDLFNALLGADVALGQHVVLGVALGYEDLDADTFFNGGNIETSGFTVAPYALFAFNENVSVDVAGGASWLDNEQRRLDRTTASVIQGEFDSDRWFVAANLSLLYTSGAWVLGAQLGVLHTDESQDGYAEVGGADARTVGDRELDLTQGRASVEVGYGLGVMEPFVRITYVNDFSRDDGQEVGGLPGGVVRTDFDDDEWRFAGGLRFFGASGLSGLLEVEAETGREDFDSVSVLATMRADF